MRRFNCSDGLGVWQWRGGTQKKNVALQLLIPAHIYFSNVPFRRNENISFHIPTFIKLLKKGLSSFKGKN